MEGLSLLTQTKIKILEEGLSFSPITLFTDVFEKKPFKAKTIFKKPVSDGKQVYDFSERNELIPSELVLSDSKNASIVKCRYNENSSIELKYNDGQLSIYKKGKPLDLNVEFVREIEALSHKIDDEHTVGDYVDVVGLDRISLLLFEGCYNWICGKQCKFCDLHPKKVGDKVCKPTVNNLYKYGGDVEKWWGEQKELFFENTNKSLRYLIDNHEFLHKHLFIMAGNLTDSPTVWKILIEFVDNLAKEFDMSQFDSIANVCPHDTLESLQKLKDLGVKQVQYNLEIADKEIFTDTCPGKIDYDSFVGKLKEATRVFGKGNVRSNFVFGLQSKESLVEECEKFAEDGIVSDYSVFQPKKNTPLASKKAPILEDTIYFTEKLANIYKKHDQKPIFCSLSSRSSIVNEVYNDISTKNL